MEPGDLGKAGGGLLLALVQVADHLANAGHVLAPIVGARRVGEGVAIAGHTRSVRTSGLKPTTTFTWQVNDKKVASLRFRVR